MEEGLHLFRIDDVFSKGRLVEILGEEIHKYVTQSGSITFSETICIMQGYRVLASLYFQRLPNRQYQLQSMFFLTFEEQNNSNVPLLPLKILPETRYGFDRGRHY